MATQLSLFGDDDLGVPIPKVDAILLEKYGTPERVARLMLEAVRKWKSENPKGNVLDIVPPSWKEYIKANL